MALEDQDSIVKRLNLQDAGGILARSFFSRLVATTATTTTTGGLTIASRFPSVFSVPSLSGSYSGWELTAQMLCEDTGILMAALEYDLGVLNVATNVFTAGADAYMPTKNIRINGTTYSAEQTASLMPMLVVDSGLTATTPTITITYENEDGVGSRTASVVLPTNPAANTAFQIAPHFQSPDTGLRDVTNMTRSTGTLGQLSVKGILPVAYTNIVAITAAAGGSVDMLMTPVVETLATAGEKLAFYQFGQTTAKDIHVSIFGRPI